MMISDLCRLLQEPKKPQCYDDSDADRVAKNVRFWEATRDVLPDLVTRAQAAGIEIIDFAPEGSPAYEAWEKVWAAWAVSIEDLVKGDIVMQGGPIRTFQDLVESRCFLRVYGVGDGIWGGQYSRTGNHKPSELRPLDDYYGTKITHVVKLPADWELRKSEYTTIAFWLTPAADHAFQTEEDFLAYAKTSLPAAGWPCSGV